MRLSLSHAPRSLALALAGLALSAPAAAADQRSPDSGQRAASKEQHYVNAISSLTPAQVAAAYGTSHPHATDAQVPLPAIPTGPLPQAHGGPQVAHTTTPHAPSANDGPDRGAPGIGSASNTANVYVPAPAAFTDTNTRPAQANVYVPPAAAFTDTVAPPTASASSQPVHRDRQDTSASSTAFNWGSALIGAAVTAGLVLILAGGLAAAHRARVRLAR